MSKASKKKNPFVSNLVYSYTLKIFALPSFKAAGE